MTSLSIGRNSVSAFNDGIYKVITSKLSLVSVLKREKSAFADGQEIVQSDIYILLNEWLDIFYYYLLFCGFLTDLNSVISSM
ncbi:hypothetical protein RO3G_17377 [Rhizopus delemar RA 99-880]|uniref:Uncharacterized protein n=1 Tax=Rhizopus delemar (strain RA 99-880 / ATCC MYA-4621 / FGSC 9543 / NRRL 43880) TaxID=246409 RepID=I1CW36_RHIO9|nr:hypothetical protein RO3G_17377 [Rhizopus delemar RA 99-880]|eukprot:EIE92666.1 hypothetical protein RO3G_17377 [Rhizopus delemar RA 99-880]